MDFIDVKQHARIREHAKRLDNAQRVAGNNANAVADIGEAVDRLVLACTAMWELLCEHTAVTNDDLLNRIREIDMRDGKLDGRAEALALNCDSCKRPNSPRRDTCIYCGETLPASLPI